MFLTLPATGKTLAGGGFPVCVTKETCEQYMRAYMMRNEREYQYLLKKNLCFLLPGGVKITVLERSVWNATVKVRVFAGDEAIIMWTHYKNVKN